MDEIYEHKNREERIELVYSFMLQNTNGRESHDEMFKLGIEACYDELINEWQKASNGTPKSDKTILMITDYGFTVLIGKYVNGIYYQFSGLEPWTMNDLSKIKNEVLLWKYLELPNKNLLK